MPVLYINFLTHNENGDYCPDGNYVAGCGYEEATIFSAVRKQTKLIADTIRFKGASWNFQSDWTFITGMFKFDKGDATTNGKNLIRWFAEDNNRQIEVDAHSHEDYGYNYADVVKLLDSAGGKPTRIVGGFTYNTRMNDRKLGSMCIKGRTWDSLGRGLYGTKYPSFFCTFDILWGGSFGKEVNGCVQTGHTNDAYSLGIWQPKAASDTDFFIHDSKQRLIYVGKGYDNTVDSTNNVQDNINKIILVLDSLQSGKLPPDKIYVYCIDIHQKYFKWAGYPAKVAQLIDALKPYVQQGRLVWNTLSDKVTLWKNKFQSTPNMHPYALKTTAINNPASQTPLLLRIEGNPVSENCTVTFFLERRERARLVLHDMIGREHMTLFDEEREPGEYRVPINLKNIAQGFYTVRLQISTLVQTSTLQVVR